MKRCSQCEFVYEDDQARCDMDGGELVYEPTLYPAAETAMTVVAQPMKFRSRSFILTAAATVIMGSFLGVGFFGLSDRSQPSSSPAPITKPASEPSIVQPAMAATSSDATSSSEPTASSTHKSAEAPAANVKSRSTATPSATSASTSAKPAPAASRSPVPKQTSPAPTKAKREEDSKVGSMLKKTGRILKKPFKW